MIDTLVRSHTYKIDAFWRILDAFEEEKEQFLNEVYGTASKKKPLATVAFLPECFVLQKHFLLARINKREAKAELGGKK